MPVGATIAAVGSVAAAGIGASAAQSAGKTQANAANQATNVQQQMFNQTRESLQPFIGAGSGSLSGLNRLLGLDASGAAATPPKEGDLNIDAWLKANPDVQKYYDQTPAAQTAGGINAFAQDVAKQQASIRSPIPTYTSGDVANWQSPQEQALQALPGYQFARDQGIQSVNRSLGSMGQTGAQAKGIARFVTGLADQTYGEQVGRLQSLASLGENAAAGAGNIGSSYANSIGNNIVGAGAATASGTVGAANAITGGLGQIPSYLLASKFLGGGTGGFSAATPGIYGAGISGSGADLGGG